MVSGQSWPAMCGNCSGEDSHISHSHKRRHTHSAGAQSTQSHLMTRRCCTEVISVFITRFCCVPVDFEVVNVDSSMASEDDISNAIMAIRRNGVALKGKSPICASVLNSFRVCDSDLESDKCICLSSTCCRVCPSVRLTLCVCPGNIETNHNLPPSYKSRNNLLR